MKNSNLFGWASNVLNATTVVFIIKNTTSQCFDKSQLTLTALGLIVALIVQIYSTLEENIND